MFSRIIVGTDGSGSASGAGALRVDIAQQTGATVHIVSAFRDAETSIAVTHAGVVAVPDSGASAAPGLGPEQRRAPCTLSHDHRQVRLTAHCAITFYRAARGPSRARLRSPTLWECS
jgi:hypothetical protein